MQLTRKEGERGQEQGDSWEVTAVIRVAVEVGRRGQPGYTVRRHGKEVNADLINAATRLYWEDAKCKIKKICRNIDNFIYQLSVSSKNA